ncbi:hypothetical protein AB0C13_38950 [Streptomyces sp. NPDC049099]|uniref:hypothetical protein n=1 Tax=Streptomyces sp. NPDC049099 TaxID=3155768 RepID=UPI00342FC587
MALFVSGHPLLGTTWLGQAVAVTDLARLHTAQLTHATGADAVECTHDLVRDGRVPFPCPGPVVRRLREVRTPLSARRGAARSCAAPRHGPRARHRTRRLRC